MNYYVLTEKFFRWMAAVAGARQKNVDIIWSDSPNQLSHLYIIANCPISSRRTLELVTKPDDLLLSYQKSRYRQSRAEAVIFTLPDGALCALF
jgi:hypothetical protein